MRISFEEQGLFSKYILDTTITVVEFPGTIALKKHLAGFVCVCVCVLVYSLFACFSVKTSLKKINLGHYSKFLIFPVICILPPKDFFKVIPLRLRYSHSGGLSFLDMF